jgi:hypothetical protein
MDPFSLTAGVIAVLQLANKVISLCLNLHSSFGSRKELDLIVDEIHSLRDILQRLARLKLQDNDSDCTGTEGTSSRRGPLSICSSELDSFHKDLLKAKSSGLVRTIAWIVKEKELEGRLGRLSRAKQTLQLSLSLDQTYAHSSYGGEAGTNNPAFFYSNLERNQ